MFTFGSLILGLTLLCLNYEQIIHSIFFCFVLLVTLELLNPFTFMMIISGT